MNRKNVFALYVALGSVLSVGVPFAGAAQKKSVHNSHNKVNGTPNYVLISPGDTEEEIVAKAASVRPSPRQLRWQELELTAFFHFGVNTFTGREWGDGKEDPAVFQPTSLDALQWVKAVKAAGIKQVIITAKHHDGFCLWPTATTAHSVKSSPWKNGKGDVVKEVAEACKKEKIGFGVYLSPWDRNAQVYGSDAYNDFFVQQLTELLTRYGKVDEVWFDGANGEGPNGKKQVYDFDRWYRLIRRLQPEAVIAIMGPDVRWVGTESGYGRDTEWSVVPTDNLSQESIAANSQQGLAFKPSGDMMGDDLGSRDKIRKAKGLVWYPAETDVSIRPGWFYHETEDNKVKSPEKLEDIYYHSVGKNGVLLLNVPPDKRGLLHENDVKNLAEWGRMIRNTFAKNLLEKARVSAATGSGAAHLLDGAVNTVWSPSPADGDSGLVELTLSAPATFDVLLLREQITKGQRIERFEVEYHDGTAWKELVKGTTIGYKRLLRFSPVTAHKIRLRILSSRKGYYLASFGAYRSPRRA